MTVRRARSIGLTILALGLGTCSTSAQNVTSPEDFFGHTIGADYELPNYTRFAAYWRRLAEESPRMALQEIGRTAEGRPQLMAVVTSPDNHLKLSRYQEISRRLALAEGVDEAEAIALAHEGRAVVWIDGGLHATEVLGAQQLLETVYQMVSGTDPETLRILDDVVMLFVHANPDGHELVADWYMRESDPLKRTTGGIPRLYHKYVGHDNNRDSYMVSQPETENMARILYTDWMPQIMYNHHQVGPAGAIMWAPPFRYPANYNIDPLVLAGIEQVGMAMQARFIYEDKPGVTMREGGPFSTWWNGGLRTTAYFHNIIGLLTETQGNPTPLDVPFVPSRIMPDGDYLLPIEPQTWHFRQSIDYEVTANRAVLDYASRNREQVLRNIWKAGRNQIERGRRDSWRVTPERMAALARVLDENDAEERFVGPQTGALAGYFSQGSPPEYFAELRRPEDRDPRGYILPSDQPDFPTATKFVNALIKNGVRVHQATRDFEVSGRRYPAGSWIVKSDQAYRPHVLDMFEPQDHPDDFTYEGGAPVPPYDNAGYTLAYQMGVTFHRILEGFEGPFDVVQDPASPPPGRVANAEGAAGFLLSHAVNDVAIVTNRLLAQGHPVSWLKHETVVRGRHFPAGTVYVPGGEQVVEKLSDWAAELGIDVQGTDRPPGEVLALGPARVGLWDQYGGSIPSGWTRWIFETFEFPYELVYPSRLNEGDLRKQYDVLVFVTDAIPARDSDGGGGFAIFGEGPDEEAIPPEFRAWLGEVTVAETVPHLLRFMEEGGTVIAIGTSTALAGHAGLPLADHLVDGEGQPVSEADYYVPGSVLRVRVDNTRPLAFGVPDEVDVFFNNSPVLRLQPEAPRAGVTPVAWFDDSEPLRSGWAWGQHRLRDGIAIAEARVGRGHLFLFGPEITMRGQPHGTFKFLFNGIHLAGATEEARPPVS
ncbi:MAG: M14 family metallopeptidase [Gemmatimonadota bacterium]